MRTAVWVVLFAAIFDPIAAGAAPEAKEGKEPPLLLDPRGARAYATTLAETGDRLKAGEIALLTKDASLALDLISGFTPKDRAEEARKTRLELDAYVLLGQRRLAEDRLAKLSEMDGWKAHARRQRAKLSATTVEGALANGGALGYALGLAFLVLAGARELLRFHKETLIFAVLLTVAVLLSGFAAPLAANAVGLAGVATLAVVHAASAAVRRIAPGPRGTVLILLLVFLATGGAVLAVLSRLELSYIGALLSL